MRNAGFLLIAGAVAACFGCAAVDTTMPTPDDESLAAIRVPEAEPAIPPGAAITLRAETNTPLPAEPLIVSGELLNRGAEPIQIPGRWRRYVRLQVWIEEKKIWRDLDRWWEPSPLLPPLPSLTLAPGAALPWEAEYHTFSPREKEPLFAQGATVLLRAAFLSELPKVVMASAPITMRVGRLSGEEAAAARALAERNLTYALLPNDLALERVPGAAREVEAFLSRYPGSAYADYLRAFYVAQQAKGRAGFSRDLALRYRTAIETNAPWLLERGKNQP